MAMNQSLTDLSKEELIEMVHKLKKQKKYGLVWEDQPEYVEQMMKTHLPVLKEKADYKVLKDESLPHNLLLEGDNLHSMKVLEKTHKESIDVIYIDPPYNTKNKEFVYNDRYVGEDDEWRHSYWLSFMEKRLKLGRQLLAEDGVIFISIDDNEQAQLKQLCDDIFGEHNFIAMPIHKNNSNKNQSTFIGVSTEYVLIYAKSKEKLRKKNVEWKLKKPGSRDVAKKFTQLKNAGYDLETISKDIKDMYKRPKYSHLSRWNKVDDNGVFKDADLSRANGPRDYTITNPETDEPCVIPTRGWGKSHEELLRLQEEDLIWYGDPDTPPGVKAYITEDTYSVVDSFWYYDNSVDTKMLRRMFGKDVFNNPKPVNMIKDILSFINKPDAIVLDFFAGSGTTGQAVIELNAEDGGKRQCILCTNNEISEEKADEFLVENEFIPTPPKSKKSKAYRIWKESRETFKASEAFSDIETRLDYQKLGIARGVTYERLKRVINGYTTSTGDTLEGKLSNLCYYVTDFVDKRELSLDNYELIERLDTFIAIKENAYSASTVDDIKVLNSTTKQIFIYPNDFIAQSDAITIKEALDNTKENIIYIQKENKVDTYINQLGISVKFIPGDFFKGGELNVN